MPKGFSPDSLLLSIPSTQRLLGLVGRADLLCAVFFVAAFYAYVRGSLATSVVAAILAMLCKESGVAVL